MSKRPSSRLRRQFPACCRFIPDFTFKGSSLTGWHGYGNANWRAENGEIVAAPQVVERVVALDPPVRPAERARKGSGHLALFTRLPMVAQAEHHQAVLRDEFAFGFGDGVVGAQAHRAASGRGRCRWPSVRAAIESRFVRQNQIRIGPSRLLENVERGHGGSGDSFHNGGRVAGYDAVGTGCGPVAAQFGLDAPHCRIGSDWLGACQAEGRDAGSARQQRKAPPRYVPKAIYLRGPLPEDC